jgi:hypothetical protein
MVRSGDYDTTANFNTAVTGLSETIGVFGLQTAQHAETTGIKILEQFPVTSGFGPFQIHYNSFANTGTGTGTFNHAAHAGFNVNRHSSTGVATSGKPSLIMGMEDNYYDDGGDAHFGMEWYVEYYSPNGTSIQQRRPFYTRVQSDNNVADNAIVKFELGADGVGQFIVKSDPSHTLFQITPSSASAQLNYIKIQSGVTGSGPLIGALGETNTPLFVSSSGSGRIDFESGFFSQVNFRITHTANGANFLIATSAAAGANASLAASAENILFGSGSALSTAATAGYVMFPSCAGTPTGVPTGQGAGKIPMVFDTTGVKLWFYTGGAWKGVVVA